MEAGSNLQWCFDTGFGGSGSFNPRIPPNGDWDCNLLWCFRLIQIVGCFCGENRLFGRPGHVVLFLLSDVGWQKCASVAAAIHLLSSWKHLNIFADNHSNAAYSGHSWAEKWFVHHRLDCGCIWQYASALSVSGSVYVEIDHCWILIRDLLPSNFVSFFCMFAKALCNLQISFWTWNLQTRCPYPMETFPDLTPIQQLPLWSEVSVNDPDRYPHLLSVKNCFIRGISFVLFEMSFVYTMNLWILHSMNLVLFAVRRIRGTICPFAGAWGNLFSLIECLDLHRVPGLVNLFYWMM